MAAEVQGRPQWELSLSVTVKTNVYSAFPVTGAAEYFFFLRYITNFIFTQILEGQVELESIMRSRALVSPGDGRGWFPFPSCIPGPSRVGHVVSVQQRSVC